VGLVEGFYFYLMMLYRDPDKKEHRSKTQSKANSSIIKLEKQKHDPFASSWDRVPNGKRKRKKKRKLDFPSHHTAGAPEPDFFAPPRSKLRFQGVGKVVWAQASR
jgi:hypothetical protein